MYFIPETTQLIFGGAKHKQQIVFYLYFNVPGLNHCVQKMGQNVTVRNLLLFSPFLASSTKIHPPLTPPIKMFHFETSKVSSHAHFFGVKTKADCDDIFQLLIRG
jgi:hypothetical protein